MAENLKSRNNTIKVIMVDSLIGNAYSTCLAESLQENGAELHLIVPENRKFSKKEKFEILFLSPSKGSDISKFTKIFGFAAYLLQLYRYIKDSKCDVVHYQFFRRKEEVLFFRFLKWRRVKLVVTAHNVLPHENSRIDYYLKSIVYKNANAIIVHSKFIKEKLIQNFSVEPKKVSIIPHGNFDYYLPSEETSSDQYRTNLSLNKSDDVLLFFGFIRPYKGLDLLLKAFEKAAQTNDKLKLIVAGSVLDGKEAVLKDIASNKFSHRILPFLSYIPSEEVVKYFKAADVVVLPYKDIDHSGIIHLAYSFGKAVLGTNVGDFNEVIEDCRSGKVSKSNEPDELANSIVDMFKDKAKLDEMGAYANYLSKTKYSWQDIAKKTIQIYKNVIDENE